MKILITGVPGTGKTTLGNYLAEHHGLFHQDMEVDDFAPRKEFAADEPAFLDKLALHPDVVVTWGFGPYSQRSRIELLRQNGFTLFWLDGNRIASFRTFMERQGHHCSEEDYYLQMHKIVKSDIVANLKPIVINPFNDEGVFRPTEVIAREVLDHLSGTS